MVDNVLNTTFKVGLHTEKDRFFRIFEFTKDISYTCLISFFLAKRPRPRSARSGSPIRKRKLNPIDPLKKKSKAKLVITTYIAFLKQYFGWPYLQPSSVSLTTCRIVAPGFCSWFLFQTCRCQKIWLWRHRTPSIRTDSGVELKTSVGWGREFQTYVCCISFWRKKKNKQKKKQNKTKKKNAFRGSQQDCWSKFVVFALEQIFGNKFLRP